MAVQLVSADSSFMNAAGLASTYQVGNITLACWLYYGGSSRTHPCIVDYRDTVNHDGWSLFFSEPAHTLKVHIGNGADHFASKDYSPYWSAWRHVAATYDGATERLYVDAVEVASAAVAGGNITYGAMAGLVPRIGYDAAAGSANYRLDAQVADCRIYSAALTAGEVKRLYYGRGADALVDNLILRLLLDEKADGAGAVGTCYDVSVSRQNWAYNGGPTYRKLGMRYGSPFTLSAA
jgi:hypothetical protein